MGTESHHPQLSPYATLRQRVEKQRTIVGVVFTNKLVRGIPAVLSLRLCIDRIANLKTTSAVLPSEKITEFQRAREG
jgi:hypothetical protein